MRNYVGTYQQKSNQALWKNNNVTSTVSADLRISFIPLSSTNYIVAQSLFDLDQNKLIGFCEIYDYNADQYQANDTVLLQPWTCNNVWYLFDPNGTSNAAVSDRSMKVRFGSCSIDYIPLCIKGENNIYSLHQYLFGTWRVEKDEIINGHYYWINDRINYKLYWNVDTLSWVIVNEDDMISAICYNQSAVQPQHCHQWLLDINDNSTIYDIQVLDGIVNGNTIDCIQEIESNDTAKTLCVTSDEEADITSDRYQRQFDEEISTRFYWTYQNEESDTLHYIIYNDYYRFWGLNTISMQQSIDSEEYRFVCLQYDQLNPANCSNQWYDIDRNVYITIDIKDCTKDMNVNNNNKGLTISEETLFIILYVSLGIIGLILMIIIYNCWCKRCIALALYNRKRRKIQNQTRKPQNMWSQHQEDLPQLPDFQEKKETVPPRNKMKKIISVATRSTIPHKNKLKKKRSHHSDGDTDQDEEEVDEYDATGYVPNSHVTDAPITNNTDNEDHENVDNEEDHNDFWDNFDQHEFGMNHNAKEIEMVSPSPPPPDISPEPILYDTSDPSVFSLTDDEAKKSPQRKTKKRKRNIHYDDDDNGLDL